MRSRPDMARKKSAINPLRSELLKLSAIPKAFSQAMPNQVVGVEY
ncbi:hypothetical protein [Hydrocoleum sp. CS-953]|nr:hypothetical protein [Hydrocoleum sp. CS-953]